MRTYANMTEFVENFNPYEYVMRQMRRDFKNLHGEDVRFKWRMSKQILEAFYREIPPVTEGDVRILPDDGREFTFEGWAIELVEDGWVGIEIVRV